MCKQVVLLTCVIAALHLVASAPPPFITKCKSSDTKCTKDSTNAAVPIFAGGLPEYNVETMDPLVIKHIDASEGSLHFVLKDVTVVGLKNCEAKKVQLDKTQSKLFATVQCTVKLDGDYDLNGAVLILPIQGNGKIHAELNKAVFDFNIDIAEKDGNDGKKYWQIKSWSHTFELKEKSKVVFENLFEGNEVLGRAARDLVRDNGNEVITEIGPKVVKALLGRVVKNVNHFFKAIPSEDLSYD